MSFLRVCRCLWVAGIGALLLLLAPPVLADGVRPVQVLVKELPSGECHVRWTVPKVMPPQAMPSPRLPDGCSPVGERSITDQPAVWLANQVYRCPDGLAGQTLGMDFPLHNPGFSTLMRVEFVSGARYARLLNPGEESWRIPEASGDGFSRRSREARQALIDGVRHFFGGWVHLVFLAVLCLIGGMRGSIRLATAFLLGQMAGVVVSSILSLRLDAPLAEIGVALATVLLAREALRPPDSLRHLAVLAVCAGAAHGLGIQNLVPLSGHAGEPGLFDYLVVVLGMDAALSISAMVLSGLGRLALNSSAAPRLTRIATYGVAGAAFAMAISALVTGPAPTAEETGRRLRLPSAMTPPAGTMASGSQRVALNAPDAVVQSFVTVEAFEVRHEILVRLRNVATLVGVGPGVELGIDAQSEVKDRVREFALGRVALVIDGEIREPVSQRVDFLILDPQGVLPRPAPIPEQIEAAWVGVTAVYLSEATAQDLSLVWEFGDTFSTVPATVIDPESARSAELTAEQPALRWSNELTENPVPRVSAVAVEPTRITVPVWSVLPSIAALLLIVMALRRHNRSVILASARILLALAILLGPLGAVAFAVPGFGGSVPKASEAERILAGILPNIYRALEFREESIVFDRLALGVHGEALTEVYLEHRKALEAEERGGARARVEAVEMVEVDAVKPADPGGFEAEAVWTVSGTVTHFGHRHLRQNRYDARVTVVPDLGNWKLQSIEVINEQRLR